MADPGVQAVQALWSHLTVALLGIGTLEPSPLLRRSGNTLGATNEQEELRRAGAVGDVCLRYFDAKGDPVESSFDQRVIGIGRDDIMRGATPCRRRRRLRKDRRHPRRRPRRLDQHLDHRPRGRSRACNGLTQRCIAAAADWLVTDCYRASFAKLKRAASSKTT